MKRYRAQAKSPRSANRAPGPHVAADAMSGAESEAMGWGLSALAARIAADAAEADAAAVMRAAADHVLSATGAASVSLGVVNEEQLHTSKWVPNNGVANLAGRVVLPLQVDSPLTGAVRTRQAKQQESPGSAFVDVAVPLVTGDEVVGAISLELGRADAAGAVELLKEVAPTVALGLIHANLQRSSRASLQEVVTVLGAVIEGRDAYTESHCVHLAESGLAVGVRLGLASDRLDRVVFGGLLHDIGKVAVPDAVLSKPAPLTSDEFDQMKAHASIGEDILSRVSFLSDVAPVVGQHHERWDGSGYPRGLRKEEITLEARILAVVDTFDAMTTTRPYRAAFPWDRAVEEIHSGSGVLFDPDVVKAFVHYLSGEEAQWRRRSPT